MISIGFKLIQEVLVSYVVCFNLLKPYKLHYQIKHDIQNQNACDHTP